MWFYTTCKMCHEMRTNLHGTCMSVPVTRAYRLRMLPILAYSTAVDIRRVKSAGSKARRARHQEHFFFWENSHNPQERIPPGHWFARNTTAPPRHQSNWRRERPTYRHTEQDAYLLDERQGGHLIRCAEHRRHEHALVHRQADRNSVVPQDTQLLAQNHRTTRYMKKRRNEGKARVSKRPERRTQQQAGVKKKKKKTVCKRRRHRNQAKAVAGATTS